MKRLYLLFIIFITSSAQAQQTQPGADFIHDFKQALNKDFTEPQLDSMFVKYDAILTPHSDVTQLVKNIKGHLQEKYPLYNFKYNALYIDNIDFLLNSTNTNHRILAYLLIASSYDISKQNILLQRIKSETQKGNLIWAGMALLYIDCDQTTPLFDFLVKNEDFGDAHMLPLYIKLNKDSLQHTAYQRINSDSVKARILAAQILSVTPVNAETERLIKKAVKEWDIRLKGYAIYTVAKLQMGDLLETFKPLLDSPETRAIALKALANSPTPVDVNYVKELVSKQDSVSGELLNSFYESTNIDNIKYWLTLMVNKPHKKDYTFFVFEQPLIKSDDILPQLHTSLQTIKDPDVLGELVRALEGRADDNSVNIMITLLKNQNSTVRYWTAKTLQNNPSPKTQSNSVKQLISNGLEDGNK
jgi:hypothetical protein